MEISGLLMSGMRMHLLVSFSAVETIFLKQEHRTNQFNNIVVMETLGFFMKRSPDYIKTANISGIPDQPVNE